MKYISSESVFSQLPKSKLLKNQGQVILFPPSSEKCPTFLSVKCFRIFVAEIFFSKRKRTFSFVAADKQPRFLFSREIIFFNGEYFRLWVKIFRNNCFEWKNISRRTAKRQFLCGYIKSFLTLIWDLHW